MGRFDDSPETSATMQTPSRTNVPLQTSRGGSAARWALLSGAVAVALFLMTYYVQLLNDSVARGAHWRYSQSTLQNPIQVGATPAVQTQEQRVRAER